MICQWMLSPHLRRCPLGKKVTRQLLAKPQLTGSWTDLGTLQPVSQVVLVTVSCIWQVVSERYVSLIISFLLHLLFVPYALNLCFEITLNACLIMHILPLNFSCRWSVKYFMAGLMQTDSQKARKSKPKMFKLNTLDTCYSVYFNYV